MSLLIPDTGLLFWMILSFGVVFFILAKYGFPVIIKMVENRKEYIDHSLKLAKEANEQLADMKAQGEAILADANKEQGRILKEAMAERDKIILDAKKQAEIVVQKQLNDAKNQIKAEEEDAVRNLRRQVAVLAVDIAEKIIRKELKEEKDQLDMIERMVDEVTKN
ncbi:F0F1 ATP synthase subunit B [Bacteroides sp. OttesenSCG-928-N06]|nr:F0F1 ATP synthase subunit B [Bacteroides sp. OttesenSCG-928-N06]